MNLRYLTDNKGSKTAVVIPIKEWEKYNKNLNELHQMLKLKYSLKTGLTEASKSISSKKKLITLKDFIDEL